MCRCCQTCWEDFYWNCFEEKFCYDESIANYNPEDDEDYIASQKNGALGRIQHTATTDNNNLTVPTPICNQPIRHNNSNSMSNSKIHEEDLRETQINVPMLGPEILAVFANSQIFQDHQPTKLTRISTKTYLAGIHSPNRELPTTPRESEQDRLIKRLEANLNGDATDSNATTAIAKSANTPTTRAATPTAAALHTTTPTTTATVPVTSEQHQPDSAHSPEKRITFTITADSSPEGSQTFTPKKFDAIAEEEFDADSSKSTRSNNSTSEKDSSNEVILRPRLIDRHPHLMPSGRKLIRSATSVPHFHVRSAASETDIFSITGSGNRISMTPEVPSISFSNLPKNYEDTPTIEKYRVSQSLYSIQTANAARAQDDYSMPRYFRRSAMLMSQSSEVLTTPTPGSSTSSSKEEVRRPEKEKSKRLQMLRGTLPPLLIHSVSFRKTREEGKQLD